MRLWLARVFGQWMMRLDPAVIVLAVPADLRHRTTELTVLEDRLLPEPGRGEGKRHRVYARLLKEFPHVSRRLLGAAIEGVLQ